MITKRLTGWFVASFLWSLTAFSQSATSNAAVVVEARQTDFQPQTGVIYSLAVGTNVYHSKDYSKTNPGPPDPTFAEIWAFANEFVARTALRNAVYWPSGSAGRSKEDPDLYYVGFQSKTNGPELFLMVNRKEQTVKLKANK